VPPRIGALALLFTFISSAPALAQAEKPPAGMDTYLLGILRSGQQPPAPADEAKALQQAHRQNMERMAGEGLLVGAGPLLDAGDYRGIFIFKSDRRAEVERRVQDDPLIQSGRLVLELLTWWGPEKVGDRYFAARRDGPPVPDTMVSYQLAFLKAGPNRKPGDDPETETIQAAHMAHIRKMGEAGQLVAAGPFVEEGPLRGIFVFKLDTIEQARELARQDPAVQAGRLVLETYTWLVADGVLPEPKRKQ
jgi:uncharacterized protein YciI